MTTENTTNFIIGVSISLLASFMSSLGVNIQAAALQKDRIANELQETPLLEESDLDAESSGLVNASSATGLWAAFRIVLRKTSPSVRREAWDIIWSRTQWYIGTYL